MGADQVAEITPGVREALEGRPETCVTFEVTGDSTKWLQFIDGVVNAAFPFEQAPELVLAKFSNAVIEGCERGTYVTCRLSTNDAYTVSRWIDRYFCEVLGCADDYAIDVRLEQL